MVFFSESDDSSGRQCRFNTAFHSTIFVIMMIPAYPHPPLCIIHTDDEKNRSLNRQFFTASLHDDVPAKWNIL
jgi:hypothetical protein